MELVFFEAGTRDETAKRWWWRRSSGCRINAASFRLFSDFFFHNFIVFIRQYVRGGSRRPTWVANRMLITDLCLNRCYCIICNWHLIEIHLSCYVLSNARTFYFQIEHILSPNPCEIYFVKVQLPIRYPGSYIRRKSFFLYPWQS